jgi:hypothetical protein
LGISLWWIGLDYFIVYNNNKEQTLKKKNEFRQITSLKTSSQVEKIISLNTSPKERKLVKKYCKLGKNPKKTNLVKNVECQAS